MLPGLREGTGTAEGVALVAPGPAGAPEEQREEGAGRRGPEQKERDASSAALGSRLSLGALGTLPGPHSAVLWSVHSPAPQSRPKWSIIWL